jgi:hypothetical protein
MCWSIQVQADNVSSGLVSELYKYKRSMSYISMMIACSLPVIYHSLCDY